MFFGDMRRHETTFLLNRHLRWCLLLVISAQWTIYKSRRSAECKGRSRCVLTHGSSEIFSRSWLLRAEIRALALTMKNQNHFFLRWTRSEEQSFNFLSSSCCRCKPWHHIQYQAHETKAATMNLFVIYTWTFPAEKRQKYLWKRTISKFSLANPTSRITPKRCSCMRPSVFCWCVRDLGWGYLAPLCI